MGQKVHPTGFRVGITQDWLSRWYALKDDFGRYLIEDQKIRKYVKDKYGRAGISKIELERKGEDVQVIMFAARPGLHATMSTLPSLSRSGPAFSNSGHL